MTERRGKDRLIVALDVPTPDAALALVAELENVAFFKVGLELLFAGGLFSLLERLQERRRPTGGVFVDLKLAGDIGNTITALVNQSSKLRVRFMTVVESVPLAITLDTIHTVRRVRNDDLFPELLMVPYLSSLGTQHLRDIGVQDDVDTYIMKRGTVMVDAGCDGLIVSGQAIRTCRDAFGPTLTLVSPGIRPTWAASDDHARLTTPAQAIHLGSDYLVVGRPIRTAESPHDAAQRIIDEIDEALVRPDTFPNSSEPTTRAS